MREELISKLVGLSQTATVIANQPWFVELAIGIGGAIVSGLIVGGILAWSQGRSDRRRERERARLEWKFLRARLQTAANREDLADILHVQNLVNAPVSTNMILSLAEQQPLVVWADLLNDPEVEQLVEILKQRDAFISLSGRLQTLLSSVVRRYHPEQALIMDDVVLRYVRGLVYDLPEDEFWPWVPQNVMGIDREVVAQLAREVFDDTAIQQKAPLYRNNRQQLSSITDRFIQDLQNE
jgi:hypothetical protein